MTEAEVIRRMQDYQEMFSVVRLVDLATATQYLLDENGALQPQPFACFATWHRHQRCENCISARATQCHSQSSRLELCDGRAYFALARYLEMDGRPYTIELVSWMADDILVDAFGRDLMASTIAHYNERLYRDSLTGVFNRRYYDEMLQSLPGNVGLMVIDVDDFKTVNDTFGHAAGDEALKAVAGAIRSSLRESDPVVRYGGDEFLAVMLGAPYEAFRRKVEEVRLAVALLDVPECPGRQLTVSIGGLYSDSSDAMDFQAADRLMYEAKRVKNRCVTGRVGLRTSA